MKSKGPPSRLKGFVELTKPRITLMIIISAAIGYFMALKQVDSWFRLLVSLLGIALSSSGSAALNNYLERDVDLLMERTRDRPLPSGLIQAPEALFFGIFLVLLGTALLSVLINLLTGFLALLTSFLYVLVYTPLKRVTWLNTFVGAIPGALPIMGGWSAATGSIGLGAWILFGIMFAWQHPHFFAIAWMYKDDYAKGGFRMLPVVEPDGHSTARQIILYSLLLIWVSVLPTVFGMAGFTYLVGAIVLGAIILASGLVFGHSMTRVDARRVLFASLIYLPALLLLIVGDSIV